jgi:tetratricopeptide (TPR) repeat protein
VKQTLILLILCLIGMLAAQTNNQLPALRLRVAQNPVDAASRLELAYQLMLAGSPEEALLHYDTVLTQDPGQRTAAEGSLWALQALGRFKESLQRSNTLLRSMPDHAPFYSYYAYGASSLNRHLRARHAYAMAEKLAETAAIRNTATLGKAWEYLYLQDYPAARRAFRKLPNAPDSTATRWLQAHSLLLALGFSSDYQDKKSGSFSAAYRKSGFSLKLGVEEIYLDGARFRTKQELRAGWQSPIGTLEAGAGMIHGDDQRVYPGNSYALAFKPAIYIGKLKLTPSLGAHYSSFERFDIQQADLGLKLDSDRLSASFSHSLVYQDNDALGSDTERSLTAFSLGGRIGSSTWLHGYLYLGNQAWWTSPYGVLNDTFTAHDSAYAISIYSPLSKKLGVLLYHQIGYQDNEADHSSSFSISYSI